ncbi:MAG: hypothetical protein JHD35_23805 [Sphingopyxis sp.]|nr:hypothetical protein [Sphingopyxis sp.]
MAIIISLDMTDMNIARYSKYSMDGIAGCSVRQLFYPIGEETGSNPILQNVPRFVPRGTAM